MFGYIYYENLRQKTIEKIQAIVKSGYVPNRGQAKYEKAHWLANCFEHACFGFANDQLLEKFNSEEARIFGNFSKQKRKVAKSQMFSLLQECGLKISRYKPKAILKSNQWNVSLYFGKYNDNKIWFHLLRQENDGTWSGKDGFEGDVDFDDYMPRKIKLSYSISKHGKIYTITNPYAKEKEAE